MNLLIVSTVILLFYSGLQFAEIIKRKKEKKQTDPRLLKARKITSNKNFTIKNNEKIIENIISKLNNNDIRVPHLSKYEAIIYTSNSGKSKFDGMIHSPPEKMPLRIILKLQNNKLSVRLDEDYGFQKFMGSAKQTFKEKYRDAFDYYMRIIETTISI